MIPRPHIAGAAVFLVAFTVAVVAIVVVVVCQVFLGLIARCAS